MSSADALQDRKGDPIKLVGGSYTRHRYYVGAWLDTGKATTLYYYHIIVEKPDPEDPNDTYLEAVKALKTNCVDVDLPPSTYLEAAFQQVPQLGERLTSFASMAAKCRISRGRELSKVIKNALDREASNLFKKGARAEYRIIDTTGLPDVVPPDETTGEDASDI